MLAMAIGTSRITAQGQISVPSGVRKKLGVGPGAVLEWEERDGEVLVRRAGLYTSEDVHAAAFPEGAPARRSVSQLKEGIRSRMRKRCARD
jgi:AbrB family looped-hinge helix DNA binding protein